MARYMTATEVRELQRKDFPKKAKMVAAQLDKIDRATLKPLLDKAEEIMRRYNISIRADETN